jgi:hypothetical protein
MRLVGHGPSFDPVPTAVDSRNQTETRQCRTTGYEGRPERRQLPGPAEGRALRTHAVIDGRAEHESVGVDRLARATTSAATSSAVGVPRTTLTSGSASIDRSYDGS